MMEITLSNSIALRKNVRVLYCEVANNRYDFFLSFLQVVFFTIKIILFVTINCIVCPFSLLIDMVVQLGEYAGVSDTLPQSVHQVKGDTGHLPSWLTWSVEVLGTRLAEAADRFHHNPNFLFPLPGHSGEFSPVK